MRTMTCQTRFTARLAKIILVLMAVFSSFHALAQGPMMWGMTQTGGAYNKGVIFKQNFDASGFQVLINFTATTGYAPMGTMLQSYSNGKLYGMTSNGGANNLGTIFCFNPSNNDFVVLTDFNNTNGATPTGNMMEATNGIIYGMTQLGGTNNYGVLFSLDPVTNAYTVLANFDGTHGKNPMGSLMQASNGKLYGMTNQGGNGQGTIFCYDIIANTLTDIFNFSGSNGSSPYGSLIQATDGKLYGMTNLGGTHNAGVIFKIDPSTNAYSVVWNFDTFNQHYPFGTLKQATNGLLYGLTSGGGALSGNIFSFDISTNVLASLITFGNNEDPHGSLMQAGNGKMYFMTYGGGANSQGKVMQFDPGNNTIYVLHDFDGTTGLNPIGDMTLGRCAVAFFHSILGNTCQAMNSTFINTSIYAGSYRWYFGDGGVDSVANPNHQYADTGLYSVKLVTYNLEGCNDSTTKVYHVVENPPMAALTANITTGCPILTVTFNNTSAYSTNYKIFFGDGYTSTYTNPIHNYTQTATYDVRLVAYDTIHGCMDTLALLNYITVLPTPPVTAAFSLDNHHGCGPLTINFTNTSALADSYKWYFGDGDSSTVANPTHTYFGGDSVFIKLIAYSHDTNYQCVGSNIAIDTIVVHATPTLSFFVDSSQGCLPLPVHFTNTSTNAISYLWDFGDGGNDTATNPVHLYTTSGHFTISLIGYGVGGCNDTVRYQNYISTQVRPVVNAAFAANPNSGCPPLTVSFVNNSLGAGFYQWRFGDGGSNSIDNPSHSYLHAGNYSVTLIAYNYAYCGLIIDTTTINNFIHVLTPPNPIITLSSDTLISNYVHRNQWYNNSVLMPNDTNQKLLPPATSCYYTMVTDSNGCVANSNTICFNYAGINELTNSTANNLTIYPNPFTDEALLTINPSITNSNLTLIIYSITGQTIKEIPLGNKTEQVLKKDGLPAGMYFYKLLQNTHETIAAGKLIIE